MVTESYKGTSTTSGGFAEASLLKAFSADAVRAVRTISLCCVAAAFALAGSASPVWANADQAVRNFDLYGVKLYQDGHQAVAALERAGLPRVEVRENFMPWDKQIQHSAGIRRANDADYTEPALIRAEDQHGNVLTVELLGTPEGSIVRHVSYRVSRGIAPATIEARFREKLPGLVQPRACFNVPGVVDSEQNQVCLNTRGVSLGNIEVSMHARSDLKNMYARQLGAAVQQAKSGQINNRGGAANF